MLSSNGYARFYMSFLEWKSEIKKVLMIRFMFATDVDLAYIPT